MKMNTQRKMIMISGVFAVMFVALIAYIVFTAVNGTLDGVRVAIAFIVLFFGLAITVGAVVMIPVMTKTRTGTVETNLPRKSPMSYETSTGYCSNCGANLGTEKPDVCPECKEKVNKVL